MNDRVRPICPNGHPFAANDFGPNGPERLGEKAELGYFLPVRLNGQPQTIDTLVYRIGGRSFASFYRGTNGRTGSLVATSYVPYLTGFVGP